MPNELEQIKNTINSLREALNAGQKYASMEDVAEIVASIKSALNFLKQKDLDLESIVDKQSQQLEKITKSLNEKGNLLNDISNLRDEIKKGLADNNVKYETLSEDMTTRFDSLQSDIIKSVKSKGNDLDTIKTIADGFESKVSDIDTQSEEIETTINVIKKEFSDTLIEMKKELNTLKESIITTRTSGGTRRVFQPYVERFTHQTNGSKKVFYLKRAPLKTDTIEVSGTDFPIILDPTVDFTVQDKTLTLSDNIPAPSSGATLIIKYYA